MIGISLFGVCQIKTATVSESKVGPVIEPYDSSKIFLGYDPLPYTGCLLYLPGKSETTRKYGYDCLIIDYLKPSYSKENKFKGGDYELLANRYFKVLEVISPRGKYANSFFKLEETVSKEICYFEYNPQYRHSFPFIPIPYYNYVITNFLNKKIVTRGHNWLNDLPMVDMNTGMPVEFASGTVWEVIDVVVEQKYFNLSLVLQNNKNERIPFTNIDQLPHSKWALFYDDIIQYEGTEIWNTIINGKVNIGFTSKMTLLSWGEPDKINRSSYNEQWVYGDQYLYFENGKLTGFN